MKIVLDDETAARPVGPTIRTVLSPGEKVLAEYGVENPRVDAELLLAHALNMERWRLYVESSNVMARDEARAFHELIEERLSGSPLAYILGWTGFYNLVLKVDDRALVPRPETELLVDRAITILRDLPPGRQEVLDLGCGSGCVGLALARELPGTVVRASDISDRALALARENAELLGLSDRISFRRGNLFQPWRDHRETGFDLILSNPPYLSDNEWNESPPEIRLHEPPESLRGGRDGLDVIRRLVQESPDCLKPGGWLLFEIGADHGTAARALVEASKGLRFMEIVKDYAGHDRVVVARKR